jgi:cadmium resistance protein CadD (predicted permease)
VSALLSTLGIGVAVFVSTNLDDLLVVAAFFADPRVKSRSVVAGQFLGIGALVLGSALAALLALRVPAGGVALLGLVPLLLGLRKLIALRGSHAASGEEERPLPPGGSQLLAVAGVTVANGGDNLGAYIPLFASTPAAILSYASIFAVMTGVWCLLAHRLATHRALAGPIRRYGHVILPLVLIALGLHILSRA